MHFVDNQKMLNQCGGDYYCSCKRMYAILTVVSKIDIEISS